MPPWKTASGAFDLMRVTIALKSVSLSVVRSWPTIATPIARSAFSTSEASPSPYAVLSSTMAARFAPSSFAMYAAIAGPCWSSRPMVRKTLFSPRSVSSGLVADPVITGMPALL